MHCGAVRGWDAPSPDLSFQPRAFISYSSPWRLAQRCLSFFLKAVISSSPINQTSLFLLNSCSPDQKDLGVLFWNTVTCSCRNFPACSVPSKPSIHPVSSCSLGPGWSQPIDWSLASFSPGLVLCRVCRILPLCGVRSSKPPLNCPSVLGSLCTCPNSSALLPARLPLTTSLTVRPHF